MAKTLMSGYSAGSGSGSVSSGYFYTCPSTKYAQITVIQFGYQSGSVGAEWLSPKQAILNLVHQTSSGSYMGGTAIIVGSFPFSGKVSWTNAISSGTFDNSHPGLHVPFATGNIAKNGTFIMAPDTKLEAFGPSGFGFYYKILIEEVDKTIVEA